MILPGTEYSRRLSKIKNLRIIAETTKADRYGEIQRRAFLNIASIGFDAEIIRDLHRIKRFVKVAYVLSVFASYNLQIKIELILTAER